MKTGRIAPADRAHLADWLARFHGTQDVTFAFEACTGWRYVAEEMAAAGVGVVLAEPADTAAARGRRRHPKTDRADARLLRELVAEQRVPTCWVPPTRVLEDRALLELYHDLRREHTAWVQRVHAVLFHQGAETLDGVLRTAEGQARLAEIAATRLSPAGRVQITTAERMLEVYEEQLAATRRRIVAQARYLRGARLLHDELYGVGPVTALALTCWLGGADRFTSSRQAVRFTGLDITVYSCDGKRSPGHLSRQGPAWVTTRSRQSSPAHSAARNPWPPDSPRIWPAPDRRGPAGGRGPGAPRSSDGTFEPRPAPPQGMSGRFHPAARGDQRTA